MGKSKKSKHFVFHGTTVGDREHKYNGTRSLFEWISAYSSGDTGGRSVLLGQADPIAQFESCGFATN